MADAAIEKEVLRELAAFLDSPAAGALALPRAEVRRVAEAFLTACYADLGRKPSTLDGEDLHEALAHRLPGRLAPWDPAAEHVPAVLYAYFDHLEGTAVVPGLFEIRQALAAGAGEFLDTVRTGRNAHAQVHEPLKPFVHGAPKLGRNDPCSCGSGKKFKKCHGREA